MAYNYKECIMLNGGRSKPITRLIIPMKLFLGLSKNSKLGVSYGKIERLFKKAFGVRSPGFKGVGGSSLLPHSTCAIVELPQGVSNGMGRLRRFVDSLHANQCQK
jgi:hypothetical protein